MAEHVQVPPTRIEIHADPIAVEKSTDSPFVSHIPCTLNLFFNSELKTAFFKFRLSVRTDQQEDQSVYLLVSPEQITSVTVEDEVIQDPEISQLCNFSRGAVRLRIELSRAGLVVGPQTWPPPTAARLDPQAYHDLEWLGLQTRLAIYISRRAIPIAQLQEFCTAMSTPGLLKASAFHANIPRLYGGQGGKIIENFSPAVGDDRDENDISTQSGSPPPYDEAAAGPSAVSAGLSPGPEQRHSQKHSMKRRRPSSSPEQDSAMTNIRDPLRFFQDICNKIIDERQAAFREEIKIIDERQAAFREEVFTELGRMEARVMHAVEERVGQLQDSLTDDMEQGDRDAVAAAGDLIEEAFDDKITGIKVELEDFVRDEFRDVETSIWDQLEAGTWEASFMRRREQH